MDDVVREFRDIDADMRLVLTLSAVSWDLAYLRDDLEDVYTDADFDATYREHMGNQISSDNMRQTVNGGTYFGQMYLLEDIVIFQFPPSRYEAIVVSYDRNGTAPVERAFVTARKSDL